MLSVKISERYTIEELKTLMEEKGYKWKDFEPDPTGNRYRNWYYRNSRKINVLPVFHFDNTNLIFYEERDVPDHPLKGKGKFMAIYLHDTYYMCPVTLVEAEIVNVWARIRYVEGEPLRGLKTTSPTRLVLFHPYVYYTLKTLSLKHEAYYETWTDLRVNNLIANMEVGDT